MNANEVSLQMVVRLKRNERIGYIDYITDSRRVCILTYINIENNPKLKHGDVCPISELIKANTIIEKGFIKPND